MGYALVSVATGVFSLLQLRSAARESHQLYDGLVSGLDGWVNNLNTGETEGKERNRALRLSLQFTPNDIFDAFVKVEGGSFEVLGRNLQTIDCPPATGAAGTCAVTPAPVLAAFGPTFAPPLFASFDDTFDTNTQYNGPVPARFTQAVNVLGAAESGAAVPPPVDVSSWTFRTVVVSSSTATGETILSAKPWARNVSA
jgi:hypothetical protein